MADESRFVLKQWPANGGRKVKPSDLQNFSLYYRKDIQVTLAKQPPWETQEETSND